MPGSIRLTASQAEAIEGAIKSYVDYATAVDLASIRRLHKILPLLVDSGGVSGITSEGHVLEVMWDSPGTARVADPHMRDLTLIVGARQFPFLRTLLPEPGPRPKVCPMCGGSGSPGPGLENVVCWCGGLGWVPDYWQEMPMK